MARSMNPGWARAVGQALRRAAGTGLAVAFAVSPAVAQTAPGTEPPAAAPGAGATGAVAPGTGTATVTVIQAGPRGEVAGVRQVAVRFSAPVVALGSPQTADPFAVRCTGGAAVQAAVAGATGRWTDDRRWVFDFAQALPPGAQCTVSARAGWQPLQGRLVLDAVQRSFQFSTGGPAVLSVDPPARQTIEEGQHWLLRLSGPALPDSVVRHARCEVQGVGAAIGVRIVDGPAREALLRARDLDADADPRALLLLTCARALPPESTVRLVWSAGIASADNPAVQTRSPRHFQWTVRKRFTAEFSCERERASAPCMPLSALVLRFSAPVPRALAAQVRLHGEAGSPRAPSDLDGDTAAVQALRFAAPLPALARFRIVLPTGLQDDAGRPLANAGSFPLAVATGPMPPLAKLPGGAFGVIEAGPDAALPITLRHVQGELRQALGDGRATGQVRIKRINADDTNDGDAELLRWLGRLQADRDNEWETRARPMLDQEPGVQRLVLPASPAEASAKSASAAAAADPAPTEVIGLPLPRTGYHVVEVVSQRMGSTLLKPPGPMHVRTGVLVTNLSVHFKLGRSDSLVWVTTLDRARPVAGAALRISDCRGQQLWSGRSDAQGLARVPRALRVDDANCLGPGGLFVTARHTAPGAAVADLAFVSSSWTDGIETWRYDLGLPDGSGEDDTPPLRVHTVFDRSLLRAGDTVSMKHYARVETPRGMALPAVAERPTELRISHVVTGVVLTQPLAWTTDGRHALSTWAVPASARLGEYEVTLHQGERQWSAGRVRVEAFRVPLVDARLVGPGGPLVAPAALALQVQLNFTAGGGLAQTEAQLSALLRPREPAFAAKTDFADHRFAPPRPAPEGAQTGPARAADGESDRLVADKLKAPTDARGAGKVTIKDLPKLSGPSQLRAELTFPDPNGEIQTVAQSLDLWPAAVVAGVRARAGAAGSTAGERQQVVVQAVVLDTAGKPLAGRAVAVHGRAWRTLSSRQRLVGGFYAWDHREEARALGALCEGRTDARGRLDCSLPGPVEGELELIARAADDAGRVSEAATTVWLSGAGEMWFAQDNDDRIELLPEQRDLQPGQTARLQVRMPFREATALVTVEQGGVLDARVVTLRGRDPVIEVPIPKRPAGAGDGSWAPNVVVSAFVLRGRVREVPWYSFFSWGFRSPVEWWQAWRHEGPEWRAPTATVDLGKPAHKLGLARLDIGLADHRLDVSVAADRSQYGVRQTARVTIAVREGGAPVAGARVAFAAVDEALLALKPNDSWDLLAGLMPPRAHAVSTSTALGEVIGRRHYGRKALPAGGGGGGNPTRELLDTLLLWRGDVVLDAKGQATLEVPLNDALTSFRLVAVADAGTDRYGTGATTVRVTQDLQMLPGLAPIAREGDRMQVPFTLRNTTSRAMTVTATLSARATADGGAGVGTAAPAMPAFPPQSVTLAAGAAAPVHWEVTVPAGASGISWEAAAQETGTGLPSSASRAADRIRQVQAVLPAVPVQVVQATLQPLDGRLRLPVAPPAGAVQGAAGRALGGVQVGLQATLAGGLPGLRRYFENYPYTCLEQQTSRALGLGDAAAWQRLMEALPNYLDSDGLALYFPARPGDAPRGSDRLSAYLLAASHEAGQALPAAPREALLQGLAAWVEGRIERRFWAPVDDEDVRRLAALAALARYGRAEARMLGTVQTTPDAVQQWPTSALLDWIDLLRRVPGVPARERRLAEADQTLRARLDVSGTTLRFSTEASDGWSWLMDGPDANAARLVLLMHAEPAWREDLPRLVNGALARQRGGAWDTTTANLWGTLALRRFAAGFERGAVAGRTRATLAAAAWAYDWPAAGSAASGAALGVASGAAPASASASTPGTAPATPPATARLPWPDAAQAAAGATSLDLMHEGTGRPWVTVQALAAVPRTTPLVAGYRIARSLVPVRQQTPGRWQRGDVLRVRLEVDAQADMAWVVVADPVPAGASLLGSGLGRDSALATAGAQRTGGAWIAAEERRFDSWRAYAEYLPRGRHVFEYTLRLNTPGRFVLPPTRVEAMYAPERHGELPLAPLEIAP